MVIACQVLQDLFLKWLPPALAKKAVFLEYALHIVPSRLTATLQGLVDDLDAPSLVVLGYGLCGNGLAGLKARGHTLLLPRVDDCIAVLLGSRQAYRSEFETAPGTYYLSKGWLDSASNPLRQFQKYLEVYDVETAGWLMDQQYSNYRRLAMVAHSQEELDACRPQAREVARFCERWNMRYEEIVGSDGYVRRLLAAAEGPESAGPDFVVVPPGGEIVQTLFT